MSIKLNINLDKINYLKSEINDLTQIINNLFIVYDNNIKNLVHTNEYFNTIPITKNLPPSIIEVNYHNFNIQYNIVQELENNKVQELENNKAYFIFNGNFYKPDKDHLLRYSKDGTLTEDYIEKHIVENSKIKNQSILIVTSIKNLSQVLMLKENLKHIKHPYCLICLIGPHKHSNKYIKQVIENQYRLSKTNIAIQDRL